MTINEAGLDYWDEKELEIASRLLVAAEGWNDRVPGFDPVTFSLQEAERFIATFKKDKYLP